MADGGEFSEITFLKIDVDECQDIAEDQDVQAMPTFKFFKDGAVVETVVGANENKLKASLLKLKDMWLWLQQSGQREK